MRLFAPLFLLLPCICFSQMQGSVWCFGDSSLANYSDTSIITTGICKVKSRGSCASISDSLGNLLFYCSYDPSVFWAGTDPVKAFNSNHQLLMNGDSMKGGGLYNEITIVPMPDSANKFYIFYIGVLLDEGLYYATVDMSANGGNGAVEQKNIQLQNFPMVDCLTAIKHGNGRDWWILFRRSDSAIPNNEFHSYLVTPAGISDYSVQFIGSFQKTNLGDISFSRQGSHLAYCNPRGLLELFNFDRCTGIISNPQTIRSEDQQSPYETYWSNCYSPSGDLLYVTRIPLSSSDTSRLYQFDLTAPNILGNIDTLWETTFNESMGALKLGNDGKIYQSTNFYQIYPYDDTSYNSINMNLSVINSPDSLGASCILQPYSFSLGGARTYLGLPNNPDYSLGALIGSGCDTITSVDNQYLQVKVSNLYPNPNRGIFLIDYFLQNNSFGELEIYNTTGQVIYSRILEANTYSTEIRFTELISGIYVLRIKSGSSSTIKKFIVQ